MSISSVPELESPQISFAGSGSTATWQGGDKSKRSRREGWGWAIIRGDYFKHFGLRGRLFEGRLLFGDCFVSESWLSMIILSHSNCPGDYVMVRKDRAGSRIGCGVAIILYCILLFCYLIGKLKRWMSLIAWNLSISLHTMSVCRHDDLV